MVLGCELVSSLFGELVAMLIVLQLMPQISVTTTFEEKGAGELHGGGTVIATVPSSEISRTCQNSD